MRILSLIAVTLFLISCGGKKEESSTQSVSGTPTDTSTVEQETHSTVSDKVTEFHPNGNIRMEGKLDENGERDGLWTSFYDDGSKWSENYYSNGLKDGHSITFFPNGQIRYIGEYLNDEKVGTWTFYDEEGNVVNEETF